MEAPMDSVVEKLDAKLKQWNPDTAEQVKQRVAEIIDLADQDALDIMRSRTIEQEVLDLLDEPTSR
jgi:ABC-type sugar transport system ATPase subunit